MVLALVPICAVSQGKNSSNEVVSNSFVEYYNSRDYDAIFLMFSEEMQQALPYEELSGFLSNVNSQVGAVLGKELIRYEEENAASYKTRFEGAVLNLFISLDPENKVNGLYLKPYVEELFAKNAVDNLSGRESFLTKHQMDLIFNQAKFFPDQTQISIGFIENGKTRYFGLIRHNDSISQFDNHQSIFEIGSITKVFTSNLLALTVLENRVDLEDNINDYLSLAIKNNQQISFKSLANHSSGLPRMPSDFEVEKLDTVSTVRVRHILIPYKGAAQSSSDLGLTKMEAKHRADSIFSILTLDRARFEGFVPLSSDKEVSDDKGEIEFSYFDGFVPVFRDYAFENEVGSLGLIETRFGFHIIEILSKSGPQKVVNVRSLVDNPYKFYKQSDLENYLENLLVVDENGKGNYLYSNLGAGLLGYTLAEVYDLSYEELFQKYIFSKYNMHNSTFERKDSKQFLVKGLDAEGNIVSNWDFSVLATAGGLLSNVEDLSHYVLSQFENSNPELELMREKTLDIDVQRDLGLGWHIVNSMESKDKLYTHGGGTGGYTSSMLVDLKNKIGIVILSNVSAFNPNQNKIELLSYDLIKEMRIKYATSN